LNDRGNCGGKADMERSFLFRVLGDSVLKRADLLSATVFDMAWVVSILFARYPALKLEAKSWTVLMFWKMEAVVEVTLRMCQNI